MAKARAERPAGADGQRPDRTLLLAMVRLADLAARPFQEDIGRRHRLGLSEWRALAALHARPGSTATGIAQLTGLDKMSVSRALASLEAAGRVVRRPDPADGRRALASLTTSGRALYRSLAGHVRARESAITGTLSAAERRQLAALVERMTEAALQADDRAPR